MTLSELCIKRPVFTVMINLAILLAGYVSLGKLPVRELPDIDPPIVTVTTIYAGANAKIMETEVTERIEEVVKSVQGIKTITSESRDNISTVTVEFDLSRPIDLAAQDVRDRVSRVRGRLPDDIDEPIVAKQDSDARPMLWIALFSSKYSTIELTNFADRILKDPLQTVSGVSSVIFGGEKRFAIRIRLDSEKLAGHGVTVLDVEEALRNQNVELPSGRVQNADREFVIEVFGELKEADQFKKLVLKDDGISLVRLGDVGTAEVGVEDEDSVARFNSRPAVGLGIVKQSKANTIEVAKGIKAKLERIKKGLPEGIETFVAYDESVFVQDSIEQVWSTLIIAFFLVVITIFIFLQDVRATLVPSLTIPVSIIGTFAFLSYMDYSVNILTLLGLVLAIGMVVDDSIVVLENIFRHVEDGMRPLDAAIKGMQEITFAVIATTVSLCAVFVPLAFQTTITGRLFIEFAMAISAAVVISSFVALTLTPMVAGRVLRKGGVEHGQFYPKIFIIFERFLEWIRGHYARSLDYCLRNQKKVLIFSFACLALTFVVYKMLESEFLPDDDKGRIFCLSIAPEGATSDYTNRMVRKMESIVRDIPEVAGYFSAVALARGGVGKSNEGLMFIRLKEDRSRGVKDVIAGPKGLRARFFGEVEGAFAIPILPKAIGGGFSQSFQLVLKSANLKELDEFSQKTIAELQKMGSLGSVRSTFNLSKPEVKISIDRDRAATLGISILDVARYLQILFGGQDLSSVKLGGKEYDVIVQLDRQSRMIPDQMENIYIRSKTGRLIQLGQLVNYEIGVGPNSIQRYNGTRSATIEGTPQGQPLGTIVSNVDKWLAKNLPKGFDYEWKGEADDLGTAARDTTFVVILGLIVIYMVLAAQFESLIHPVTVMLALPLGALGALLGLWFFGLVDKLGNGLYAWANFAPDSSWLASVLSALVPRIPAMTINLFSQIGMILLFGLVTKNSILLVDFANRAMKEGKSPEDAMREAGSIRLRPILMTAFSTVAGILPIAVGFGAGAESRRPMGIAVVCGMLVSTALILFVAPVFYVVFAKVGVSMKQRASQLMSNVSRNLILMFCFGFAATLLVQSVHADDAKVIKDKLSLREVLELALDFNHDLKIARAEIKRQSGVWLEAKAISLPKLSVNGNLQRVDPSKLPSFGGNTFGTDESWQANAEIEQPVFTGGAGVNSWKEQRLRTEAAKLAYKEALNGVAFQVMQRFYDVLLARAKIKVQKESVKLLEEELKLEKNKRDAGAVSDFNVLRAEVELANARVPMIKAKNDYRVAVEKLVEVIGKEDLSSAEIFPDGELEYSSETFDVEGIRAEALESRPEVRQFALLTEAAAAGINVARSGYFPKFAAFAGYGMESSRFGTSLSDTDEGWVVGVRGSWDIFDGGATIGRTREANARKRQADVALQKTKHLVSVEIREAYSSYLQARELVSASRKVVEQATESLRLARSRFLVGSAPQIEVLDTKVALTQARTNQVEALYSYNIATAQIRRAAGMLGAEVVAEIER